MKLTRTLLAAVAVSAFAVPAAAQDPVAPATTPPIAPATAPPAEQPMMQPANPATTAPAQPGPIMAPAQPQQPTTQTAPAAPAQTNVAVTAPVPATAADLVAGAAVMDQEGQAVGTIQEADATGAVVNTGNARGRLNLDAFYKNERGLMIGYSRTEFEGLVSGLGGPETPDAEEATTPATADPAPAPQPEAATPGAPE